MALVFSSGTSDFAELQEILSVYLVDKSLFVKEMLLETNKAVLIFRPRRFGKILKLGLVFFGKKILVKAGE